MIDQCVLCSSQGHFRTRTRDLDHPVLVGAENIKSLRTRKGDLQRAFPVDVSMVPSSRLTVTADGERLTCGGFSLGETVHFMSLEFITDCFGGLSLSPRRNDSDATFMASTHCGPPYPLQAMTDDSIREFHMALSGEGGSNLPAPRKHGTVALPAPITTMPQLENAPVTQAITMVPPQHKPALEVERILIMDFAPTHAWAKGMAPSTNHEGGQAEPIAARPLSASPPPTTDGVDKRYHQLAEIDAIATAQLAECDRWHQSAPTFSLVRARASWQSPTMVPPREGRCHYHRPISLFLPHYALNPKLTSRLAR
jgi:hypothetical protein